MKPLLYSLLITALSYSALAKDFQAEAILVKKGQSAPMRVWIASTTENDIKYKTTQVSTEFIDSKIQDFSTIFVLEPSVFASSLDLFESRNYQEAKAKFAEIKVEFKPLAYLPNNWHTLAAFYEMECMRSLGEYEKLAEALKAFNRKPLEQKQHLRQLKLYVMWDAVGAGEWDRVLALASKRDNIALPGSQRVQVAYCKGLALEQKGDLANAIIQYNTAIVADSGASQVLAQQAAVKALGVYLKDPVVQDAVKNWGTDVLVKDSTPYKRLLQAGALARFYEKYLSLGEALPTDLKKFVKYGA